MSSQVKTLHCSSHPAVIELTNSLAAKEKGIKRKTTSSRSSRDAMSRGNRISHVGEPKKKNKACITTFVSSIAQGLFSRSLLNISCYERGAMPLINSLTENGASIAVKENNGGNSDNEAEAPKVKIDDIALWEKRFTETSAITADGEYNAYKLTRGQLWLDELEMMANIGSIRGCRTVDWEPTSAINGEKRHFNYYTTALLPETQRCESLSSREKNLDMDKVRIGDFVLVNDTKRPIASHHYPVSIVRVVSMFENLKTGKKYFHGRLLLPGRDTVIEEVASTKEFFLVDTCASYKFSSHFCGRIVIDQLDSECVDSTALYGEVPKGTKKLFFRFWYDPDTGTFEDVDMHTNNGSFESDTDLSKCPSCKAKKEKSLAANRYEVKWIELSQQKPYLQLYAGQ